MDLLMGILKPKDFGKDLQMAKRLDLQKEKQMEILMLKEILKVIQMEK